MIQLNIVSLFGLVALVLIGLLVVKLIFQQSTDSVAKILLIGLLAGLTAWILNLLYGAAGLFKIIPHYSYSTVILMFSIGPNLYAYVRRMTTGAAPQNQRWWYCHWLLPVLLTLAFVPYYLQSGTEKLTFLQSQAAVQLVSVLYAVNYLQILVYLFFCRGLLVRYQQAILNNYANIAQINLNWLKQICIGLLSLIALDTVLPLLGVVSTELYNIILIANSLFIVVIAYSALGQTSIQFSFIESENSTASDSGEQKYQRSGLRSDSAQYQLEKLNQLMQTEQCYLDDNLNLDALAEKLGVSAHHLSQILNEQVQKNFYDYINEQRINHAKRLLLANRQQPIIEVAYASGYNNKVSFYNSFKRFVGMTPSKFRSVNSHSEFEEKLPS